MGGLQLYIIIYAYLIPITMEPHICKSEQFTLSALLQLAESENEGYLYHFGHNKEKCHKNVAARTRGEIDN